MILFRQSSSGRKQESMISILMSQFFRIRIKFARSTDFVRNGKSEYSIRDPNIIWLELISYKTFVILGQNANFEGNFREAIWPVLFVGQIFGVMPVTGIKSRSSNDPVFKWKNVRTFHSLFIIIAVSSYTLIAVWNVFENIGFSSIGSFNDSSIVLLSHKSFCFFVAYSLFYVTNTCALCFFFRLASTFPDLMRYWGKAETELPTFHSQKQKKKFILKIRLFAFLILLLAFGIPMFFFNSRIYRITYKSIEIFRNYFSGTRPCFNFLSSFSDDV